MDFFLLPVMPITVFRSLEPRAVLTFVATEANSLRRRWLWQEAARAAHLSASNLSWAAMVGRVVSSCHMLGSGPEWVA